MPAATAKDSHASERDARGRRGRARLRSMGGYLLFWPAGEIEFGPYRYELETCPCQLHPSFALEDLVETSLDLMQIDDVERRILLLCIGQNGRAPVRTLLLFRQIDAEHLLDDVLESVLVRIRPCQLGSDFRAV